MKGFMTFMKSKFDKLTTKQKPSEKEEVDQMISDNARNNQLISFKIKCSAGQRGVGRGQK